MYAEYGHIAQFYTGWTLNETRLMPVRERRHWIALLSKRLGARKDDDATEGV